MKSSSRELQLGSNLLDDWLLVYLGPVTWWLKERWIFAIVIFVGVVAGPALAYLGPKDQTGAPLWWVIPCVVTSAALGGLAVLGDKLADRFERKQHELAESAGANEVEETLKAAEASFLQTFTELNWLLESALEIPFLKGAAKATQLDNVRRSGIKAVANAVGPGSRATLYRLARAVPGERRLVDPKHAVTIGRSDLPERHWVEAENPRHTIWRILDRSDTEPRVERASEDDADGLDWERVAYRCFVSIPVRARSATFGLLSVSCAEEGTLTEQEKSFVITVARLLALVEAMHVGPDKARSYLAVSAAPDSVTDEQFRDDEERDDDQFTDDSSSR